MENKEVRRRNLLMLAKQWGSLRALGERTDTPPAYLSQIKNQANARAMGDEIARRIEEKLGKPRGWMDTLHDIEGDQPTAREVAAAYDAPNAARLVELWRGLTGEQRTALMEQLEAQVAKNLALVRELAPRLDTACTMRRRTIQGGQGIPPKPDDEEGAER